MYAEEKWLLNKEEYIAKNIFLFLLREDKKKSQHLTSSSFV